MSDLDLPITLAEYNALARDEPQLAAGLVRYLLRQRAGLAETGAGLAAAWDDPWSPVQRLADAYLPRPPTEYLVERLLPLPSLTMVYGPPGCLKSMLLMDLAVCVAGGVHWLASAEPGGADSSFAVRQAPVLWVDLDQGEAIMVERLAAIARSHAVPPDSPLFWKSLPAGGLNLLKPDHTGDLALRMQACAARLLVIDNLGIAKGEADENTDQMIPVMGALRYLSDQLHAAVVVLHHARKESGFNTRHGDMSRGHSSIRSYVDLSLGIERSGQAEAVLVYPGKVRRRPVKAFAAAFNAGHLPGEDNLWVAGFHGLSSVDYESQATQHRPTRQRLDPVEAPLSEKLRLNKAVENLILQALQAGSLKQKNLIEIVRAAIPSIGEFRVRKQLENLLRSGRVTMQRGEYNACLYRLPEAVQDDLGL